MTLPWIDSFVRRLLESGLATQETLVGCSEQDISTIEASFKLKLPEQYKEYLRKMGRKAGEFLQECSLTFPYFEDNRKTAENLLQKTNYVLPSTAFVFVERYACQFFFFDTVDGKDNPPVFRFHEGDDIPVQIADSLTEALDLALQDHVNDLTAPLENRPYQFTI